MSTALPNMLLLLHNLAPAFSFDGGRSCSSYTTSRIRAAWLLLLERGIHLTDPTTKRRPSNRSELTCPAGAGSRFPWR
jgi:hypothetical protein